MTAFCSTVTVVPFLGTASSGLLCGRQRSSFVSAISRSSAHALRPTQPRVVSMADNSGGPSLGMRIAAGALCAGLVGVSLGPVFSGARSALDSDAGAAVVTEKLRKVPLFAVTDDVGRPFLSDTPDGRARVGYFFVAPSDAAAYLDRVRENSSPEEGATARVQPVSLDEALPFVQRPTRARGGVPERFEFVADAGETGIALELTGGRFAETFGKGVPLFFIDSLALQGTGVAEGPVTPLFFEKEKLDEFVAQAQANGNGDIIKSEDVQIVDLMQTVREMKAGGNERVKKIILFPMDDALSFQRQPEPAAAASPDPPARAQESAN